MDSDKLDISEHFRAIAELGGHVAWIIDCATLLPTYISPSVTALLGYDPEEFTEQLAHHAPDSPLALLCAGLAERLASFAHGDQSRKYLVRDFDQQHKDGSVVPIQVTSTVLADAAGKAQSVVGILRDASAERNRVLEQRRFASMLNHEFRTPLSTIDGAVQRLEVTGVNADEPTRLRYRKIQNAVDRLTGMLDEYLSPDKLEEISAARPADSVVPRTLLDEAAAQAQAAGRAATVNAADLPDKLRCQPQGVRMALKVLIDNALQYSPADSPIALSGRCADHGIELLVRDQGDGVPDTEIAAIFSKGARASNAVGKGSGLGLYMARSVVEVHGGSISMRNVVPRGAEFRIWLPVRSVGGKSVASKVINSDNSHNQQIGETREKIDNLTGVTRST